MITVEENNLEVGLCVIYNKDKYGLIDYQGNIKEYPLGGLMCEFVRLIPTEIKPIIMSCPGLEEPPTRQNVGLFLDELNKGIQEKLDLVPAMIVMTEILNYVLVWFENQDRNITELGLDQSMARSSKEIMDYIFEGTCYDGIGTETVGQLILTAYVAFTDNYITVKHIFLAILENEGDSEENNQEKEEEGRKATDALLMLYSECMDAQHIDFKIFIADGGFSNLYTIRSAVSLLIFEMANCINKEANFVKCANCGQYFVPEGRSDALYCTYPSPQDAEKSCRDVGAQVTRANKEKNDITTKEYRKVYMRYKMAIKRHPGDKDSAEKLRCLTAEIKGWRNKLAHGAATVDEFMEWLEQFR